MSNNILLRASVQPATYRRYSLAVQDFRDWCLCTRTPAETDAEFDWALAEYLQELYYDDDSRGQLARGTMAKCGAQFFLPHLRGRLGLAERALRGWNRLRPGNSPPPVTQALAIGIAVDLHDADLSAMADAVLISFDCYLRASEVLALSSRDVHLRGRLDSATAPPATLRLSTTKTGPNQAVSVKSPLALAALHRRLKHARGGKLFEFSYKQYVAAWHGALRRLGISRLGLVPHGLRHGGATNDFANGMAITDVIARGRWVHPRSATRYVQTGRSLMAAFTLPLPLQDWLASILDEPARHLGLRQQ